MSTYSANAVVTGGKHLGRIQAEGAEAALEAAYGLETCDVSLCHHCAEECEDAEIASVDVCNVDDESDFATDRPDSERVHKGLLLLELVERADEAGRGIEIDPPGEGYLIRLEPGEWIQADTLSEAVEKALEELGDE